MPHRPDLPCADCGSLLWRSRTSLPEGQARCLPCRRSSRTHGTNGRYDTGCRCAKCREAKRVAVAKWNASYMAEHGISYSTARRRAGRDRTYARRKKPRKPCDWCGAVHALNESGTTLDVEGLAHAQWMRHHGAPSASREVVLIPTNAPTRSTVAPVNCAPKRGGVFYCGPCDWCGDTFVGWSTNKPARLCSKRCERNDREAARGRFRVKPDRRRRLYERDDWTCQICLKPTSREWAQGDPWAPTLDHIEPQATALVPDHSDANLRTAHAICNAYRGDGRMTDDEVRRAVLERWLTST